MPKEKEKEKDKDKKSKKDKKTKDPPHNERKLSSFFNLGSGKNKEKEPSISAPQTYNAALRHSSENPIPKKSKESTVTSKITTASASQDSSASNAKQQTHPDNTPEDEIDENDYIRAHALYDYDPAEPDEIPLRVGDIVFIFHKHPSGWWTGECNGKYGIFPGAYAQEDEDQKHKQLPAVDDELVVEHFDDPGETQPKQAEKEKLEEQEIEKRKQQEVKLKQEEETKKQADINTKQLEEEKIKLQEQTEQIQKKQDELKRQELQQAEQIRSLEEQQEKEKKQRQSLEEQQEKEKKQKLALDEQEKERIQKQQEQQPLKQVAVNRENSADAIWKQQYEKELEIRKELEELNAQLSSQVEEFSTLTDALKQQLNDQETLNTDQAMRIKRLEMDLDDIKREKDSLSLSQAQQSADLSSIKLDLLEKTQLLQDQAEDKTKLQQQIDSYKSIETNLESKLNAEVTKRKETDIVKEQLENEMERLKLVLHQQEQISQAKETGGKVTILESQVQKLTEQLASENEQKETQKREFEEKITRLEQTLAKEQKEKTELSQQTQQFQTEAERMKRAEVSRKEEYRRTMQEEERKRHVEEMERRRQEEERKKIQEEERKKHEELKRKQEEDRKKQEEERQRQQELKKKQEATRGQAPIHQIRTHMPSANLNSSFVAPAQKAYVPLTKPPPLPTTKPALPTQPKPAVHPPIPNRAPSPNSLASNRPLPPTQRPRTKVPIARTKGSNPSTTSFSPSNNPLPIEAIKKGTFEVKLNKTGIDLRNK